MKRTIDYRVLSESRAEIMGVMILAIIFYHSRIAWASSWWMAPFDFLRDTLYFGVDIFLFLSGYGLVRSRLTNPGPWRKFIYRRLIRILPAYWLVMSALLVYETLAGRMPGLSTIFYRFSTLGFWFGKQGPLATEWFIPTLLALYLMFPFLFIGYERANDKRRFVAWVIALALCVGIVPVLLGRSNLLMMTTRIPAFVLGIHLGHRVYSDVPTRSGEMSISRAFMWTLFSFAALAVVFVTTTSEQRWRYGLWWLPLIPAVVPVSLLLGQWIAWMKGGRHWPRITGPLLWLLGFSGAYSLELLLLHEPLYNLTWLGERLSTRFDGLGRVIHGLGLGPYLEFVACTAAALALAPVLSKAAALVRKGVDSFVEAKTDEAKGLRKWFVAGLAAAFLTGMLFGVLIQKAYGLGSILRAAGAALGLR